MRILAVFLLFLLMPLARGASAAAPVPPPSARLVTAWHPRAWAPPAPAILAGLREGAEPAAAGPPARPDRSALVARTRADGSRYVLLGGRIRAELTASIGADGKLVMDCEHVVDHGPNAEGGR